MYRQDKATTERHARILRELVKRPDNKMCADCKRQGLCQSTARCATYPDDIRRQMHDGHRGICLYITQACPIRILNHVFLPANRGVFVCIRCSGIHRSMGTHISKVKSVDLDTWTVEQMEVSYFCALSLIDYTDSRNSRFRGGVTIAQTFTGKHTYVPATFRQNRK